MSDEYLSNFTPRAQQVLALARKEADRFHHHFVGTEHVLLGLIRLGQGVAVNVLHKMGLSLETVRLEVEKQVGTGPDQGFSGNIPYTPRVKKVLSLAAKEAKALSHTYVGTEHILLGLMREGEGVAARVLKELGADPEQARREILRELDPNFEPAAKPPPSRLEPPPPNQKAGVAPVMAPVAAQGAQLGALPQSLAEALGRWCAELHQALGEDLVSVILFGGLAKGDYVPDRSDINVMVVVKSVDLALLDRAAPVVQGGSAEHRIALFLLSEEDLRGSTDAFAVKFRDAQRHHLVLYGPDVLASLSIPRECVRLRCEQELRNLLLRLRHLYLRRAQRPELLEVALGSAVSSFLVNLAVLLELKTGKRTTTKAETIAGASELSLELEPVRQALALKQRTLQLDPAGLKSLYGRFLKSLEGIVRLVDTL